MKTITKNILLFLILFITGMALGFNENYFLGFLFFCLSLYFIYKNENTWILQRNLLQTRSTLNFELNQLRMTEQSKVVARFVKQLKK